MKKLAILLIIFSSFGSFAQNVQYDNILLSKPADYRKAEPVVILATDYVYASAVDKEDLHRQNAISFIMKWMQGTQDYSFVMDETVTKLTKGDNDLFGIYVTCMAKSALQKGKGADRESIKYDAYKLMAEYCENPLNKYKVRGEIKKVIAAKNENKLREYLDSNKK
jgi:hypothetical protein